MDSKSLEEGPEGNHASGDGDHGHGQGGDGKSLIRNWRYSEGREPEGIMPVGVPSEIEKAALVLQDPDHPAAVVMTRCVEGRLAEERVVEAACHAVWGRFDPPAEYGATVRDAVEVLRGEISEKSAKEAAVV